MPRWKPKTTWNRCPIEGCGVRIKTNNLCCAYHWLIIANDETYFARYWKNPASVPSVPASADSVLLREK